MQSAREKITNTRTASPVYILLWARSCACLVPHTHTRSAAVRTCFLCVFCLCVVLVFRLVGGWVETRTVPLPARAMFRAAEGGAVRICLLSSVGWRGVGW